MLDVYRKAHPQAHSGPKVELLESECSDIVSRNPVCRCTTGQSAVAAQLASLPLHNWKVEESCPILRQGWGTFPSRRTESGICKPPNDPVVPRTKNIGPNSPALRQSGQVCT